MRNKTLFIFAATAVFSLLCLSVWGNTTKDKPKEKSPIITLSSANFSEKTSKGLVLVDFWAAWCGPCRRIAPILEEIAIEYKDSVIIGKLNVDKQRKLALQLEIEALPTIIIYKEGEEIFRMEGGFSKDEMIEILNKFLEEKTN